MTVFTGELHKLVFGGTLATTEQWACSIHMATQGVETEPDFPAMALMKPPIDDWFARTASGINAAASLDFIKLNRVNRADGKYADLTDSNTLFYTPVTPAPAGNGIVPPQISTALTWHTDIIRGRGSKGRIYPPGGYSPSLGLHVAADGLLSGASALGFADSAQELLSELNNATTNLTCVVWSQVGQVARGIEQVSAGRVVDTQRRRRNSLPESRVFATAAV